MVFTELDLPGKSCLKSFFSLSQLIRVLLLSSFFRRFSKKKGCEQMFQLSSCTETHFWSWLRFQRKSWYPFDETSQDLSRPVKTKPGHNIGLKKAQKQYFNESKRVQKGPKVSKRVQIGTYLRLYETIRDQVSARYLGSQLRQLNETFLTFGSLFIYLVETFSLLGQVLFTLQSGIQVRISIYTGLKSFCRAMQFQSKQPI